jgi:cytochrome P450
MPFPQDPLAAVTHPDPYPYYADLVANKPIYHDETLGLWVASSAAMVRAVLTSDICRVRPLAEPIPRALLGSPAADIFGHLVRMNDGKRHGSTRQAVQASMQSIEARSATEQCNKWARTLLDGSQAQPMAHDLQNFAFHLPVYVIASLLGVPQEELHHTALWVSDFVRCLVPTSTPAQLEQGKLAAGHLLELFRSLLSAQQAGPANSLLAGLAWEIKRSGGAEEAIVANGIGFLSQAYEATAALLGNAVVALASHPDVREQVAANPALLRLVIEEVLRYDPPVQNTRRFLAQSGQVAGQAMQEGDVILVVLAAASRDPLANPHPERFDIHRKGRSLFTFGAGSHACPGKTLTELIAQAGIEQLLASGVDLAQLAANASYRPSGNIRLALLTTQEDATLQAAR